MNAVYRLGSADAWKVSDPCPLATGIKVIDLLCPFVRGGKTGLFGGAGVGKTVLMRPGPRCRHRGT